MPLLSSKLARGLLDVASNLPASPVEAGKRWAHAYAEYAAQALSPVGSPPNSLAPNEQVLARALAALWTTSRSAPTAANGIANALTAFWLTPPVTFGAGAVTAVGGTSILAQALPGIWAGNQGGRLSADASTRVIAAAIDAFTHTVIVTSPGPVVGPIT